LGQALALQGRLLLLSFKHGELDWYQCAEAAVWSQVIVVVTPRFDGLACLLRDTNRRDNARAMLAEIYN